MNKLKKRKGKKFVSMVMVLLLVVGANVCIAPKGISAAAYGQQAIASIDLQEAKQHIQYLSKQVGPRIAGTQAELKAAEYIESQFKQLGYQVEVQRFAIKNVVPHLYLQSEKNRELPVNSALGSGYTGQQGVTGKIIDCGFGLNGAAFPKQVQGNLALVQRGVATFAQKVKNAVQAGASGVIFYDKGEGIITPMLTPYESPIPVLSIASKDIETVKQGGMVGTITTELRHESQNVVAKRLPAKADQNTGIVHITAHYDSVPLAPGANDNASGTAAMLELARVFKAYPINKEIRFVACGSEEIGLKGSEHYVSQLTDDEITRSIGNFNLDMIATSYDKCNLLYADTVDGEANLISDAALASGALLGKDLLAVNYGRSSDHAPFGDYGIPAACFIWGDKQGKLEPWYHKPEDNLAINLNLAKLETACKVIEAALRQVLERPVTSFDRNPLVGVNLTAGG